MLRERVRVTLGHLAGHRGGERHRQDLEEDRVRPDDADVERVAAGDHPAEHAVAPRQDPFRAGHAAEEVHPGGAHAEQPLERVLEVGGGDVAVERRAEARLAPDPEAVERAPLPDLGQTVGEVGN